MPAIYHFTHIENLPGILRAGQLDCHRRSDCKVDIANEDIKAHRMTKRVPVEPGGTVCDYVPFYFAPRSPMLYKKQCDGIQREDIVYLVAETERVLAGGCRAVVTDGNARAGRTEFETPANIETFVDWPLMRQRYWSNTPEDGDRVRRRQAEFLAYQAVSLMLIDRLVVATDQVRSQVGGVLLAEAVSLPIVVEPDWYFAL